jgi:hypothetical protein
MIFAYVISKTWYNNSINDKEREMKNGFKSEKCVYSRVQ